MELQAAKSKPKSKPVLNSTPVKPSHKRLHDGQPLAVRSILHRNAIQPKLRIGQPNDKYEQEADRVANQVMRMPAPQIQTSDNSLPANSHENIGTIQRSCASCAENDEFIQTKGADATTPEVTPTIGNRIHSLQGGGQPLSKSERSFFEPRIGADFSNVRVHHGAQAATAAQSINARAFTLGHDVVFGAGEYSPNTSSGRKLLAHELTHVVQQNASNTKHLKNHTSTVIRRANEPEITTPPTDLTCPTSSTTPAVATTQVGFVANETTLDNEELIRVEALVDSWFTTGQVSDVRVDGFASAPGAADLNWRLSCDRATNMVAVLMAGTAANPSGIPANRIRFFAHGETNEFGATGAANQIVRVSTTSGTPRRINFRVASASFLSSAPCNPYTDDGTRGITPPTSEPSPASSLRMIHALDLSLHTYDGRTIAPGTSALVGGSHTPGVSGLCGSRMTAVVLASGRSAPRRISSPAHGEGFELGSNMTARVQANQPPTLPGAPCGLIGRNPLIPPISSQFVVRLFADGTRESGFVAAGCSPYPFHYLYENTALKMSGGSPVHPVVDFPAWATSTGTPLAVGLIGFKALRLACCRPTLFPASCGGFCVAGFTSPPLTNIQIGTCAALATSVAAMACPTPCAATGANGTPPSWPANP